MIKEKYDNIRKSMFVRKCNNVIRFIAVRPMFKIIEFGIKNYIAATKTERTLSFPHELAIVACAKNEGTYFKEWLDFHILVGVTKFYIYDNESDDNTKEVLQPYIDKGIVEYTYWPGRKIQRPIVYDAHQTSLWNKKHFQPTLYNKIPCSRIKCCGRHC